MLKVDNLHLENITTKIERSLARIPMGRGSKRPPPPSLFLPWPNMKEDIAAKLCIPLPLSVSYTLTKGIFQRSDRLTVNEVRVTACSPDFGQK